MSDDNPLSGRMIQETHQSPPESVDSLASSTPQPQASTDSVQRTRLATSIQLDDPFVVPESIGRFCEVGLIGQGGFGFVYRAFDPELNRPVALKVPRPGLDAGPFLEEARSAAPLKHSNIVTVYDVGRTSDGLPFIAMEYVDGPTLSTLIRERKLSHGESATLMADVARAVHFAHRAGFVHRDLKPGNILIDHDGTPKVADFGLALHESAQHLQEGEIAGTPAYMAPEQVSGQAHQFDGRTDVWAIGVILYEILGGRMPFDGRGDREELYRQILEHDPRPLRQIDDSIPVELEELCRSCLAKSHIDRPLTALDVGKALEEFHKASLFDRPPHEDIQPLSHDARPLILKLVAIVIGISIAVSLGLLISWGITGLNPGGATLSAENSTTPGFTNRPSAKPPSGTRTAAVQLLEHDRSAVLNSRDPRWRQVGGPIQPLLWRQQHELDSWAAEKETGRLAVRTLGPCLLSLGSAVADTTSLKMTFRPESWTGSFGIFWGWKERVDGKCHCMLTRVGEDSGKRLSIQIAELEQEIHPVVGQRVSLDRIWIEQQIDVPAGAEAVLQVNLEQGIPQQILWNHSEILAREDFAHLPIPSLTIRNRPAGVTVERSSVLIKSFLIRE